MRRGIWGAEMESDCDWVKQPLKFFCFLISNKQTSISLQGNTQSSLKMSSHQLDLWRGWSALQFTQEKVGFTSPSWVFWLHHSAMEAGSACWREEHVPGAHSDLPVCHHQLAEPAHPSQAHLHNRYQGGRSEHGGIANEAAARMFIWPCYCWPFFQAHPTPRSYPTM